MGKKNKRSRKEKRKSSDEVPEQEKTGDVNTEKTTGIAEKRPEEERDEATSKKATDDANDNAMKENPSNEEDPSQMASIKTKSTSEDKPNFFSSELFSALPLSDKTQTALRNMKMERMTQIQAKAIPSLLAGKDLIGAAKTGSGKVRFVLSNDVFACSLDMLTSPARPWLFCFPPLNCSTKASFQ